MMAFLAAVNELLWAAFLDDNEWWIKGIGRNKDYHSQPGVVRR